jgi:hypothetical protein
MSFSMRSPIRMQSPGLNPSTSKTVSIMIGEGFPTVTSAFFPVTLSIAAIIPAHTGISPSSTEQVRSGKVYLPFHPIFGFVKPSV